MSYLIAFAFIAILGSLASALYFMMKDGTGGKAKTSHMARALAFRVGFSVLLSCASWGPGSSDTSSLPGFQSGVDCPDPAPTGFVAF